MAPSAPTGRSRAARDVPAACVTLKSARRIRAGTITTPPPIPKIPDNTPAAAPMAAATREPAFDLLRCLPIPAAVDRRRREGFAAGEDFIAEGERPGASLLRDERTRQVDVILAGQPLEQVGDDLSLAADDHCVVRITNRPGQSSGGLLVARIAELRQLGHLPNGKPQRGSQRLHRLAAAGVVGTQDQARIEMCQQPNELVGLEAAAVV